MLKIPDKIKIGCYTYTVVETEEPIIVHGVSSFVGSVDHDKKQISIKKDIEESYKIQVLFHEILHTLFEYFCLEGDDLKPENYENIVDCISKGIVALLNDNQEFFRGDVKNDSDKEQT